MILEAIIAGSSVPGRINRARQVFVERPVEFPGAGPPAADCGLRDELMGSFSNNDGDCNENVNKAIGLLCKTTTLHVHRAFLYISLPSLLDYDLKMPDCTFYGERKQATSNFFFSF